MIEKEEVLERLKEMFENECQPLKDFDQQAAKCKVSSDDDDGFIRRSKRPFCNWTTELDRELLDL